jgi:E3 ubiquitin-protein ligase CCNP1IP1
MQVCYSDSEARLEKKVILSSHIFCVGCSDTLRLSSPLAGNRICPACDTPLLNPDDVVSTRLNPTDDYKASVLSGLSPNIIVECADRALAFWAYQTTQEMQAQHCQRRFKSDANPF